MSILPLYVHMHRIQTWSLLDDSRRASDAMELEFQAIVSSHVGTVVFSSFNILAFVCLKLSICIT